MVNNNLIAIIEAYGYLSIRSKNPYMVSFMKDDVRLNYYFTTGTITIQSPTMACKTWRDVTTGDRMEEIITSQ